MLTSGRVTVGIPTRNRSAYVVRAVRSVLAQTYADIEVIVSDNASTDDTVERVEEIGGGRVRLLKQAVNIGMAGNFNACLREATGELFLMLSDDDMLEPEAIEELRRPFLRAPQGLSPDTIGMTWCPCTVINAAGEAMWVTESGPSVEPSLEMIMGLFNGRRGPRFCSVMVRTADARAVGGYNEQRHGAVCDTGNWTRAAVRYDHVVCIPRPLACYTVHSLSETSQSAAADWRRFGESIYEDLLETLRSGGISPPERRLRIASRNHICNLIVTVLLQVVGRPGWMRMVLREAVAERKYMLTPFVAGRLVRDGWKILRLAKRGAVPRLFARLTSHIPPGQFGRYLLVGLWNTLFGYSTFAALTALLDPYVRQSYILAAVLSSVLNISVAFLGYKWFVFKTKGNYLREWGRCVAVYGSSMVLGIGALPIVVWAIRLTTKFDRQAPYLAGALLMGFSVIYNFLGHKKFSFRPASKVQSSSGAA
ncbi:MAG: glycosyltransferase [Betaproteobacteria bacterium]|nr:glycosyltransferase [Betaproteobacteria bacterium]